MDGPHQDIIPYQEPNINPKYDKDPKNLTSSSLKITLKKITKRYGPIKKEKAYTNSLKYWNITRTGKNLKRKLEIAEKELIRKQKIAKTNNFLWPPKDKIELKVRKNTEKNSRKIQEIPYLEIAKAAYIILSNGYQMNEKALKKETARLLGYKRRGKKNK